MEQSVNMTLWCKRNNQVFNFTVTIGIPKQVKDGEWECDWSLGSLLEHKGAPVKNINSMFAMLGAIRFVVLFLRGREGRGDLFYLNESDSEPIPDIGEFFALLGLNTEEAENKMG